MAACSNTHVCEDTSDAIELYRSQELYLKPVAKLNICAQLPILKEPGKSISNWEVMEKVKGMIKPYSFISLKIVKSTLEFIRLEGETENKAIMKTLIQRLEGKTIKLHGFPDQLKVKAAEAKTVFPSRHDWDSYFRDAKNMNEMKPGERPDTVHFKDLPTRWFAPRHSKNRDKPCEQVLKKVFEVFGEIRCVDIPMLDPYRKEMATAKPGAIQTFTFGQDLTFEAFVQFKEYIGFVKAMDALRGMKLLYKEDEDKALCANIKVDFDRTKHLSDKAIRKRRSEREKLEQLEQEREEKVRKEREEEEKRKEDERFRKEEEERERERKRQEKLDRRFERQKEREEKRRQIRLEKKRQEEERKIQLKIALEERKFLLAQRKLESLRLLTVLFDKVKTIKLTEDLKMQEQLLEEERKRQVEEERQRKEEEIRKRKEAHKKKKEQLLRQEKELREKILKNYQLMEEKKQEQLREALRKRLAGKNKLKSAVVKR
ncbi:hypothetical protein ACJMK2_030931 [Sinanodonta woodiana]|uniref:A-kinase anchor protein 17A n=1 Tax=Sinanodonta woodiana TaxID=1069815 RepID=A0ABD3WYL2_SINWO